MKIAAVFPYSGDDEFVRNHTGLLVDARLSESTPQIADRSVRMAEQAHDEGKPSIVMASPRVLNGLEDRGLDYYLVYPSADCKPDWIARTRLLDKRFADIADRLWDTLLDDLHSRRRARPLILGDGMLFSDILHLQDGFFKLKD